MRGFISGVPNFVIANGGTSSNVLDLITSGLHTAEGVTIVAPGTLPETVNLQISVDGGTTYGKYATALAAGTALTVGLKDVFGATHMKLVATGAVAADRTFNVGFSEEVC